MPISKKTGRYSINEILSFGARYNFIGSGRGIGKSFLIRNFLMRQDGKFMFLGRTTPDVEGGVRGFIGTLEKSGFDMTRIDFQKVKIEGVIGCLHYIQMNLDGEQKGLFFPLTGVNAIKQLEFPDDLDWVWMDEFLPEKYTKLPGVDDEAVAIQNVMITIDHDAFYSRDSRGLRKLRFIGTFNPRTWSNPILQGFHLLPKGWGITKIHKDIILELVEVPEGMLREESAEDWLNGGSARKSESWLEEGSLLEPLPKGSKPVFTLRMKQTFTMYESDGKIWWIPKERKTETKWTLDEFPKEGEIYLTDGMKKLLDRYTNRGLVRFPDMNTKFEFIREWFEFA